MRYSIMLQLVVGTTLILVGAGAFFGWLQTRPTEETAAGAGDTWAAIEFPLAKK